MLHAQVILDLIRRVRTRWRTLILLRGLVRGALAASAVLASALAASALAGRSPLVLALLGVGAVAMAAGAVIWGLWPARDHPSNARVARFIEEADPTLADRLVSAVDVLDSGRETDVPLLAGPMLADASRRAAVVEPSTIVPGAAVRRVVFQTALALLLVVAVAFIGRDTARRSRDAIAFTLFPSRTALNVSPGDVRIRAGAPLTIEARLMGTEAPVPVQLDRSQADDAPEEGWTTTDMASASSGSYMIELDSVSESFSYRVIAGALTSDVYTVTVARPPRVTGVDVEYSYSNELGIDPHVEPDSGDIYAPAGTKVRLHVHTDGDGVAGELTLDDGSTVELEPAGSTLVAGLTVTGDGSYRIALVDRGGLTNPGDTEYFIRILEDRPPEVRVLRPARDRDVTRLEEVEIDAEAADDFGLDRFELVYAIGGGPEQVVPFELTRGVTSVSGNRTLYLEDLDIEPGDFVSYYVRARDRARGRRSTESRSDIFFLQVKPFEQRFRLAQSQAMGGGATDQFLDDLVAAQKEIIVATWQLERRAQASGGERSKADVQAVARAEAELKTRVEQSASSMRTATMRDPRRRPQLGLPPRPAPPVQTSTGEDSMTSAALAMGQAVDALDRLNTGDAVNPEMEALTHLLQAQAEIAERQVVRQQAGSGSGSNRSGEDLSGLFDRELQHLQETNYETPSTSEQRDEQTDDVLDRVRQLARRQDELLRRQQELERAQLTEEEFRRVLERLSREQSQLRQQAEELARQMAGQQQSQSEQRQNGSGGGPSGRPGARQAGGSQMRAASEDMRNAATEMSRQDSGQARQRGMRALERLRDLERQLQSSTPDGRRRALGQLQFEARQLAEAERRVGAEVGRLDGSDPDAGQDAMRRLAGEQERLTERFGRLAEALETQGASGASGQDRESARLQEAAAAAAQSLDQQGIGGQMQELANALRDASAGPPAPDNQLPEASQDAGAMPDSRGLRRASDEVGRALENVADTLAAAREGDDYARRLADQLARARQLREGLDRLGRQLDEQSANADAAALARDYERQLRETGQLADELNREHPGWLPHGGVGFTIEGSGMVLSAPGTEAFKQDFAAWENLRRQATQALVQVEAALSGRLNARASQDRLASEIDDPAPAGYQQQVDKYFKALAGRGRR